MFLNLLFSYFISPHNAEKKTIKQSLVGHETRKSICLIFLQQAGL